MINHILRETCQISSFVASGTHGEGEFKDGATVNCFFAGRTDRISKDRNGVDVVIDGIFHLPVVDSKGKTISIRAEDRILFDSEKFEVLNVKPVKKMYGAASHYEISVVKTRAQ